MKYLDGQTNTPRGENSFLQGEDMFSPLLESSCAERRAHDVPPYDTSSDIEDVFLDFFSEGRCEHFHS